MKDDMFLLPGYRMNEYKIILMPHEALEHKIIECRKKFAVVAGLAQAFAGRPHLMLAHFHQYQMKEESLILKLLQVANEHAPLKVELKDYGSFPTHNIHINVTSKVPIQELTRHIRTEAQKLMSIGNEFKPHFISEPNFILGGKLQPQHYDKAWAMYQHKTFSGRFIANDFVLLRRAVGSTNYIILKRFALENMPAQVSQGLLF